MFAFGRCPGVASFKAPMRNLVFPVRRCSELEIWRGPARSTLQFSRTALHRSGKSAWISGWGGFGSRSLGNPHALVPARASARRFGRAHFGVIPMLSSDPVAPAPQGRGDLAGAFENPCNPHVPPADVAPNALALMRSEHQIPLPAHPMPLLSCDLNTRSHFVRSQCPCSHTI